MNEWLNANSLTTPGEKRKGRNGKKSALIRLLLELGRTETEYEKMNDV